MTDPEQYAYRLAALLSPAATVIGLATLAASDGGSGITSPEVVMAVVSTVTAWGAKVAVGHLPQLHPERHPGISPRREMTDPDPGVSRSAPIPD